MKTIVHVVDIKAPRAKVYEAITTQSGLAGWWTTTVKADGEVGTTIEFTFLGDFHPHMKITQLEEPSLVAWRCVDGHDNWRDNTFLFELRESDAGTSLRFTQEYARELELDVYGTYNFNWGYYLNSLSMLCEKGDGKPFQP